MLLWSRLLPVLLVAGYATAQQCMQSADIIRQILPRDYRDRPKSTSLEVSIDFTVENLQAIKDTRDIKVDGFLIRKWLDSTLRFEHLRPCESRIHLTDRMDNLWHPPVSFVDAEEIVFHRSSKSMDLSIYGYVSYKQRVELRIPCSTDPHDYPFGNETCTIKIRPEIAHGMSFVWNQARNASGNEYSVNMKEDKSAGDMVLRSINYAAYDRFTHEMNATLHFERSTRKAITMFFLPSILFMAVSWLSLILGPKSITRSIIVMGAFALLLVHYYTNPVAVPPTNGLSGIDVWKIFSLLFVLVTFVELVLVTCMASIGMSRRLTRCCNRKKGKFDVEPQYEELNDLRTKQSRRTCGCCRYSAFFIDVFTFIVLLLVFLAFAFFYFTRGKHIVQSLNDFSLHDVPFVN